ncbi:MAG TPA: hypothetical protein VLZ77_13240, partial [Acidimicrobiales bacterium]|nr:hypothetical protein [Acidimicrobiales bacterium]
RVWAPVTVIVTDEGLNGLHCHVINDTAESFRGSLRVSLFTRGELRTEEAERAVDVAARGSCTVRAETMLDGFRDVSYAYRFAPPAQDVVAVTLLDPEGAVVAEAVYLPLGQARPVEADLGLRAEAVGGPEDGWSLRISTRRFAQWVVVEVPGYRAEDSWFHLPPQASRLVALEPLDPAAPPDRPAGRVRALNAQPAARVAVAP